MALTVRRVASGLAVLMVPFISSLPPIAGGTALASPVAPSPVVVKVQGAPVVPVGATSLGATAPSQTLTGAVALAPRNDSALESFINVVTNKNSPQYGQYLAPGAFESQFGPLPSTISAVEQAVQADGLQVTGVASDGMLVDFSGTVGQAENTFHTGFDNYHMHAGWTGRGTTSAVELQLPASVSTAVTGVIGLNELVQAESSNIEPGSSSSAASFPAAKSGTPPSVAGAPTPCTDARAGRRFTGRAHRRPDRQRLRRLRPLQPGGFRPGPAHRGVRAAALPGDRHRELRHVLLRCDPGSPDVRHKRRARR